MDTRRWFGIFNKKVEYSSSDPISGSQEFKQLINYLAHKNGSLDLGEDTRYSTSGDGIKASNVNLYSITKWLNEKFKKPMPKSDLFAILWSAKKAVIDEHKTKSDYYFDTLGEIIDSYQFWTTRCEYYLNEYSNHKINLLNMPNDLASYINDLHGFVNSSRDEVLHIQSTELINYQHSLAKSFDLGDSGNGVTCLNVIKYTIAHWLCNQLNEYTWAMEWSDINLPFILTAAAGVNMQIETNKDKYDWYTDDLDHITNLYSSYTSICHTQLDKCKNDKQLNTDKSKMNADDVCSDFTLVSRHQPPYIISSSRFCKSELSRRITKLYMEMEKIKQGNAGEDSAELSNYRRSNGTA